MHLAIRPGSLIEPLTDRQWRPDEISRRISNRAHDYAARGIGRGDRVFIHFGNCNEFFVELLAVWQRGACAIPVDTRFTPFEIETLANWARPRLSTWTGAPDAETRLALDRSETEIADVWDVPRATVSKDGPATGVHLDDDALILFTSGTTGHPKGVVHTHRSLRARWTSLRDCLGLEAHERTLCLLPTHFGHGLICNCLFPWLSGCDLYILPPFKPDTVGRLGSIIDDFEITFLSSVPAVWRLAQRIARPPARPCLRRISIGSAPLSASLWRTVQEWSSTQDVINAYGITETGSWLAGTTVSGFEPEDGMIGKAWGGVVQVLSSNEPGTPRRDDARCRTGESGHVWVNTPALMRGYLDRDDLTSAVVSDGWFYTGDVGLVDERGWLYLRGREREEINKGGMKVHPADVDSVVERFEATVDVCTFGFEEQLLGEDVGIAVVLDPNAGNESDTMASLYEWTRKHLAAHQLPQRWYVVGEIPRTSRGKVNRANVASTCAEMEPLNLASIRRIPNRRGT